MDKALRIKDFKLGCLHGKKDAANKESEANIQRTVFLSQRIKIWKTLKEQEIIRIFGYEIPLESPKRGRCVDLIGYDSKQNLYVIELKKKDSQEQLSKVIDQVNDYANRLKNIKHYLEKEFFETYLLPIEFNEIKKIILAPREYYKKPIKGKPDDILYAYYKVADINKRKANDIIDIHLIK